MKAQKIFKHMENETLLKDQRVTKENREEIKKFLESNENENTTYQNLWDTIEAMMGESLWL
jgi:hypothetical protein